MKKVSMSAVGLDLGDRFSQIGGLDETGELVWTRRICTRKASLKKYFGPLPPTRVVIEVGTHSRWVSRYLEHLGHEVIVANARRVKLISENDYKNDGNDAELLARIGRFDPRLLCPIQHRSEEAHRDLTLIKSRHELVEARTGLINHVRGVVKTFGERLPSCSAATFHKKAPEHIPAQLANQLEPVVSSINKLTHEIKRLESAINKRAESYPEVQALQAVGGVGPIISTCYALTLEDPERFENPRDVGPFLGLAPGQKSSGGNKRECRITKAGDVYLRKLLVQAAHYIIGPHGKECDLRDFGLRLVNRGGKHRKQKAAVAVARKLAVLLMKLWKSGVAYDPFYQRKRDTSRKVYRLDEAA